MSPTLTTFLYEAANFLILAGVLGWLLFKPVRNALEARRAAEVKRREDAEQRLADVKQQAADLQKQKTEFEAERERLRAETRTAAEREAEEIRRAAREAARRERDAEAERFADIEQAQLERLALSVASAVRGVTGRFLEQIDGPELQQALVNAACRELQQLNGEDLRPVFVETAAPLPPELAKAVKTALGDAAASAEFHDAPDLEAGLRIRTAAGVIDASAKGLAAYAERVLAEELRVEDG